MRNLWFSILTRALLRRGDFTSRADLAGKITSFANRYNQTARPWTWTYDARADHQRYPLGPSTPSTRPCLATRSTPSSAVVWPNRLTSPLASIA